MVCSVCKKKGHNAATCPQLEVGADKFAEAVLSGAGQTAAIGVATAACPCLGAFVVGSLMWKKAYDAAQAADNILAAKTKAERRHAAKMAVIDVVADKITG